ncbi:NFX1-type zinc finger-containing protein 1-like [Copidosoma floridanum]|uniref:NFX1-type zinc finger-containing protein 1-like n=1 Tax=Copidosoma floridanum TaxID=29053 RepID=UPI0006C99CB9|nr:NFX1-type zinc finger-containing protein 1-like [Copidosoma floridanum]
MMKIAQNEREFQKFIDCKMSQDILVTTVNVLAHICQANFTEVMTRVLSQSCSDSFLSTLVNYLANLPFESSSDKLRNQSYHEDVTRFWSNLIEFFQKVNELMPLTASNKLTSVLKKIEAIISSIEISQKYNITDKVKDGISSMKNDLEKEIERIESKMTDEKKREENEPEPPQSFRTLSVIPTVEDLFNEELFLRACKVKDAYDSVDQYLDIQFRLLREDFVRPLRNGIKEYLQGAPKHRNNDLRVYKNAKLIHSEAKALDTDIQLYFGKLDFVDWKHSKRLTYGGLLLLSKDNFKTIIFATVGNRDEKDLVAGYIKIVPCMGNSIGPDMYNCNLVLLESKIYFEPYFAVLTAMQRIDEKNFPMQNYFIKNQTDLEKPAYLEDIGFLKFKDKFILGVSNDYSDWPSATELELDDSQYQAFKSAITQKLAIIQGPPGTGKTFLALQIVQALLENKSKWLHYGPIVVVCLTNHALDQFLEGILCHTKSIARVGSRSKSENLEPYSLKERRKDFYKHPANSYMSQLRWMIGDLLREIEALNLRKKHLTTPDVIVSLEDLQDEIRFSFNGTEELVWWLIRSEKEESEQDVKFFISTDETVDPLGIMDKKIDRVQEYINQLSDDDCLPFSPILEWENYLQILMRSKAIIKRELNNHPLIRKNSRSYTYNQKWQSYWDWVVKSYNDVNDEMDRLIEKYHDLKVRLDEIKHMADLEVMKGHEIVGLTTTRAAKIQSSLRALRAPIVLVEEAAEILEAHVVCAMTNHCKQVILIGDHKQLRPKASVHELGSKYNLNVSLFERMVNIRGECPQLAHQHRMRPEIAKLVSPIYEKLYNHESVLNYPRVKGLDKNFFFLNHASTEENHNIDDSWVNQHEVEFFSAFAKHLLMQGYSSDDITILCTYTGQLFAFMNETKKHELLRRVRVTTVDNFQGEESKIILLSLVRNNGQGNIGFLKEENRVCVALSRAREGLYVMGNMNDLLVNNDIWPKVKKVLEDENAIGDYIRIRCQIHRDQFFEVRKAEDFKQSPEGGCSKKCDLLLSCGHVCTNVCHILDREHIKYRCKQKCVKSCPNDHPCPLLCWQGCVPCLVNVERTLKCGHTVKMPCSFEADSFPCPVKIDVTLPVCDHNMEKPCYVSIDKVECTYECEIRLDCGHACIKKCHVHFDPDHLEYECYKDCTKKNADCTGDHLCKKKCFENCDPCPVLVDKVRSCGHHYKKVACSLDVEKIYCERKCDREMNCGHKCQLKCSDECKNCPEKVLKESSCGHLIQVSCCQEATSSKCNKNCKKTLPCGHECRRKCKESCTVNCKVMIQLSEPGMCGHILSVPCYLKNYDPRSREFLKYCKQPCGYKLACTHNCKGNCGSCFQGRIHVACSEPCRNIFICGHACKIACNQECQPCTQKCELKCPHNKCGKKCGIPCVPCKEKCRRSCVHQSCNKRCYEPCGVEPCNEPCKRALKCGHPCVGFCGDVCPRLCRVCNYEKLSEIFLGNEDDPNARFVFLPDCKHCIESKGLMEWIKPLSQNDDEPVEIKTPTCPRCKTPIKSCMRIMDQIKKDLKNVMAVKSLLFSNNKTDTEARRKEYLQTLKMIESDTYVEEFVYFQIYVHSLGTLGAPVKNKKKQYFSINEMNAFANILDIITDVSNVLKKIQKVDISLEFIQNQVKFLVGTLPNKLQISKQNLDDIQLEIRRLHLMVQVYNIFSESQWIVSENQKEFELLIDRLSDVKRFTENIETELITNSMELNERNKSESLIERKNIIKAVGLTQGHWFKCPNGHYYAIGECGGAMQRSKCIECKASIGGENHHIDPNNTLAPELDELLMQHR